MTRIETDKLAAALRGEVLRPGEDGYDEARKLWNARFDRRPDVVVRCRDAGDVRAAVDFAREGDLLLSVKSGGHAYAANTVGESGLLIDLSPLKSVEIDQDARRARVEPGLTLGDFTRQTQAYGLVTPTGTVSSVGLAGLTLGGGSGYLSRRLGLTIDNLLGADVVTADGRLVHAGAEEHPDLFWGLRGGGGNLGVVTSFEFRLHRLGPEVLFGQIVHPFEAAPELLRFYRDYMNQAPDDVQCYAFLLRVPPVPPFPEEYHGQLAMDLVMLHADPDGREDLQPLLDFGEPILASVTAQTYTAVLQSFDAALPAGQRYESRAHDLTDLSDAAIDTFAAQVGDLPGALTMAYFGAGGGAVARVDSSATAYAGRDAAYSFHIMAGWTDPAQDGEVVTWATRFHEAMAPYATDALYVNLLGTQEERRVPVTYGRNYQRLVELKTEWDPENLFRMNHNIEPGA